MSADAFEVRIVRLEGAYEQIDKRLEGVERKLETGFAELRAEIRGVEPGLRSRMDRQFYWLRGMMLAIGSYLVSLGLTISPH